ncbi:MAG: ATP-binding cassette domain-containing protein [Spirochaetes bacterium]|nr:ATP-binding cassette domain-containing protein [Spirochaetota bacterium]
MGNAIDQVKNAADFITSANNNDGVAGFLESHLFSSDAGKINSGKIKIKIRDIHKSFGSKKILRGIDLDIFEGEILCIIGPSGTGKSVILKNIIGLLDPDRGEISVDDENFNFADESRKHEIRKKFGVLFQGAALFDSMNIYDNVAFGMRRMNLSEEEIHSRVPRLLEDVGLKNIETKMPSELSGGMQKRVGLARSIALQPSVMMYDEPTTGVDPITGGTVDRLIVKMNRLYGITSVVITHDLESACEIASRIVMLKDGKVYFTGTSDDLKNSDDEYIRQFVEGRAGK